MLYAILPPTVFLLSLGGIVVLLSRVMIRIKNEAVTSSVRSATTKFRSPQTLLKPSQKGVQRSDSRWQLFTAAVKETAGQASDGVRSVQQRWQQNRGKGRAEEGSQINEPRASNLRQTTEQMKKTLRKLPSRASQASLGGADRLRTSLKRWRTRRGEGKAEQTNTNLNPTTTQKNKTQPSPALRVSLEQPPKSHHISTRVITQNEAKTKEKKTHSQRSRRRSKTNKQEFPLAEIHQAIGAENFQKAEDLLIEHISDHTRDTKAYLLLGKVCLEREEWSEAIEVFERAVKLKPGNSEAYSGLGSAALKAGKYTQALQALQRAHEADPSNREILEQLLVIAQRMDNPALQHSISEKLSQLTEA